MDVTVAVRYPLSVLVVRGTVQPLPGGNRVRVYKATRLVTALAWGLRALPVFTDAARAWRYALARGADVEVVTIPDSGLLLRLLALALPADTSHLIFDPDGEGPASQLMAVPSFTRQLMRRTAAAS